MSNAYREAFGDKKQKRDAIRNFVGLVCPVDENGKTITMTEQGHKEECDVNNIIKKYDATGLITHVSQFEAAYGDVSSIDFKDSLDLQIRIGAKFNELPSNIRKRFDNQPLLYLQFLEDPKNLEESITLGLRSNITKPSKIDPEPSKLQKAVKDPTPEK